MSKLLLAHRETECGIGEYFPLLVCVRAWPFEVYFFFSAEIQFSSDLQHRHALPGITGRVASNSGRGDVYQLLACGSALSLERKTPTASTDLPGIHYMLHKMALITFLHKDKLFLIFKYSLP